jgi:RNA polymerase sigma factor (sigma-70 family)
MSTTYEHRDSDEILFALVKSGHEPDSSAAFEELYRRYLGPIAAHCRKKGVPFYESEWLANECLWTAWRKRDQFQDQGPNSFRRWLFRLAKTTVANYYRGRYHTSERQPPESLDPRIPDESPTPEQALAWKEENREEEERIQRLYNQAKLNNKERLVVDMLKEGHPPPSIAEQIGMAVEQVYRITYRAKVKLRVTVGAGGFLPRNRIRTGSIT